MHDDIAALIAYLVAEVGLSANTIAAYRRDLEQHALFLHGRGQNFLQADETAVTAYLGELRARFGRATVQRKLSAMRQLHKHLVREGLTQVDPIATIPGPLPSRCACRRSCG